VGEVAVVGYPDEVLGERTCAVVVATRPLQLADLVDHLRARSVANQKLPERLVQVEALPKTASGKVQKYRLRELVREGDPA
jgi:cyclohexanecarboxylate-CoA ligase